MLVDGVLMKLSVSLAMDRDSVMVLLTWTTWDDVVLRASLMVWRESSIDSMRCPRQAMLCGSVGGVCFLGFSESSMTVSMRWL